MESAASSRDQHRRSRVGHENAHAHHQCIGAGREQETLIALRLREVRFGVPVPVLVGAHPVTALRDESEREQAVLVGPCMVDRRILGHGFYANAGRLPGDPVRHHPRDRSVRELGSRREGELERFRQSVSEHVRDLWKHGDAKHLPGREPTRRGDFQTIAAVPHADVLDVGRHQDGTVQGSAHPPLADSLAEADLDRIVPAVDHGVGSRNRLDHERGHSVLRPTRYGSRSGAGEARDPHDAGGDRDARDRGEACHEPSRLWSFSSSFPICSSRRVALSRSF